MMNTIKTGRQNSSTIKIVYCGMLIALSAVGALIKIQGSIALDSMPGFFAALFLGPSYGALVAGLGHILTAATSGFPLTLPMHIIIALQMALFGYLFGVFYRKLNYLIAIILAIILNGPVGALTAAFVSTLLGLPFSGSALFYAVITPLTLASAVNIILAYLIFRLINKNKSRV
ncbi:alpha-ribazole transporter [Caloranaerobacter azorensis DSM 13643]|uniref:Alpha-ribazole transporter n=2 Tax=Caloranaerobacter azorensis TaxID=116090 RepID=A0A1M5R8S8_9FIRM|nr:alpha-ribazole transporter [Caloranaerobacter azorensis DSM 13643]